MNIIIEGPDATGKTTLATKLVNKYNMNLMHLSSSTPNDYTFHDKLLNKENMVYDRFFMGELVYPEIYHRQPKLTFDESLKLMNKIVSNNDLFIVLYASDIDTLKNRLIARGGNELKYLDEIEKQNELFVKMAWCFKAFEYENFVCVDISDEKNYELLDNLIDTKIKNNVEINILYRNICKDLIENGEHVNGTKEINNYTFTLKNIKNNIVTLQSRDISLTYCAAEMLWYWTGRNDTEFIGKFASMWNRITDDGKTNNSAYGYLLQYKHGFNQIEKVIELLQKDPNSRRAFININLPNKNVIETKDEMCTIGLQFYIRDGKLNCTGIMRSNDIYFGLTYDIVYFTYLQSYIAKRLNIECGTYTHFATSMHYYDRDEDKIEAIAYSDLTQLDESLDIDKLLEHQTELCNYVDNDFTNKSEFKKVLKQKGIINEKRIINNG